MSRIGTNENLDFQKVWLMSQETVLKFEETTNKFEKTDRLLRNLTKKQLSPKQDVLNSYRQ